MQIWKYTQIKIKRQKWEMARNNNLKETKKTELQLTANERKIRRSVSFSYLILHVGYKKKMRSMKYQIKTKGFFSIVPTSSSLAQ